MNMGFKVLLPFLMILLLCSSLSVPSSATYTSNKSGKSKTHKPCKELVLFFHDVLYNDQNAANATSALIGGPQGTNKTVLSDPFHFGNIVAFDDHITLDNNFHGKPVGKAHGIYVYDMKDTIAAWLGFSFVLNSTEYKGTLNFIGSDPVLDKIKDISVVGGTGDFFMARGVATVSTDAFESGKYFTLRVDIKLYECW